MYHVILNRRYTEIGTQLEIYTETVESIVDNLSPFFR